MESARKPLARFEQTSRSARCVSLAARVQFGARAAQLQRAHRVLCAHVPRRAALQRTSRPRSPVSCCFDTPRAPAPPRVPPPTRPSSPSAARVRARILVMCAGLVSRLSVVVLLLAVAGAFFPPARPLLAPPPRPAAILPMIAVPPRDRIPGSTKGLPSLVRLVKRPSRSPFAFLRRRLFAASLVDSYVVDLHGGIVGVGEYFSVIRLGGKRIRVQIDTGSSTLAVPMRGCRSCINKINRYDVEQSQYGRAIACEEDLCTPDRCTMTCPVCSSNGACCSKEHPANCGFSLKYADGSAASGSLIRDQIAWGRLKVNVTFGGILYNSPNFERPEVDGILGMAYKALACNPSCFDPPFDALVTENLVNDVFSICMTSTGGKLMLGGYDPRVSITSVNYVPLAHVGPKRYYRVALSGSLLVDHTKLSMPDFRAAIVDTGTTLIVISTRAFRRLQTFFKKHYCQVPELCGQDSWFQSGMCVSLTETDLNNLPNLAFVLGPTQDLKLELTPNDYMLKYTRAGKTYRCVGIMGMDGLGGLVVLGNTLMQRYVTVYDRRNDRIGFAQAAKNCGDTR